MGVCTHLSRHSASQRWDTQGYARPGGPGSWLRTSGGHGQRTTAHGKAQGHREGPGPGHFYLPNKRRTILLLYRLDYPWRKHEAINISRLLCWDTSSQKPTPAAICDAPGMPDMNHELSYNFSDQRTKSQGQAKSTDCMETHESTSLSKAKASSHFFECTG